MTQELYVHLKKIGKPPILKRPRDFQRGDLFGYFSANPVAVRAEQSVFVEVPCYPKADRTSFIDVPTIKDTDYRTADNLLAATNAGIKGRVIAVAGRPLARVYVLAYKTEAEVFQMYHLGHGTPYSAVTDENGNFYVPLDQGGSYYLVARDTLGDGPHRGEIYGLYQGTPNHTVQFTQGGRIDGIMITAGTTMGQEEISRQQQQAQFTDQVIANDLVIDQDTLWSGTITINGVVSVKRGTTLTIAPGTVIRFKPQDRDRNDIGDGEILVEGKIVAQGRPDKKIIFTSAAETPKARDWSYLNILGSATTNLFEHCVFEYGYSGMQIHYSNAKIRNCLFRKNGEGLHFNTANILAEHNTFSENGVGIKSSRLEGKVLLQKNVVTKNEVGIQFVHQHINAVDFENLNKVLEPPLFSENNIFENRKYNFTMGDRQSIDLAVPNNWWGSAEKEKINDSIFDKLDDEELGQVFFEPYLTTPQPGAGVQEPGP